MDWQHLPSDFKTTNTIFLPICSYIQLMLLSYYISEKHSLQMAPSRLFFTIKYFEDQISPKKTHNSTSNQIRATKTVKQNIRIVTIGVDWALFLLFVFQT